MICPLAKQNKSNKPYDYYTRIALRCALILDEKKISGDDAYKLAQNEIDSEIQSIDPQLSFI